jgi:DNA topoisomerase-1
MPRTLGDWNEKPVKANIGRFGPYIQRWSTFASVKLPDDVYSIEYDRAVELVEEKIQKDIENTIRKMTVANKDITIKKWRRWPFFMRWRKKISLKGEVLEMSEADIEKIIVEKWWKIPKKKVAKKAAKKKAPAKKKVVAKKKPTKKI